MTFEEKIEPAWYISNCQVRQGKCILHTQQVTMRTFVDAEGVSRHYTPVTFSSREAAEASLRDQLRQDIRAAQGAIEVAQVQMQENKRDIKRWRAALEAMGEGEND